MDENRVEGTARNVGGKVQEGVGRLTGDAHAECEVMKRQARHRLYGPSCRHRASDSNDLRWLAAP